MRFVRSFQADTPVIEGCPRWKSWKVRSLVCCTAAGNGGIGVVRSGFESSTFRRL